MKPSFQPKFTKAESFTDPQTILEHLQNLEMLTITGSPRTRPRSRTISNDSASSSPTITSIGSSSTGGTPSRRSSKQSPRRVRFDPTARMILIPTIEEYKEADLHRVLWYDENELKKIEKTAIVKISTGKLFDEEDEDDFWSFIPHLDSY